MSTAKEIREKVEAAQAAFEQGEKTLYRADGQRRYSDVEHRETLNRLKAERRHICEDAAKHGHRESVTIGKEIETLKSRDLSALLTTEEMQSAAARREFVTTEVSGMDLEELAQRLRSVTGSSDRAGMYLHLTAAQERRKKARASGQAVMTLAGEIERLETQLFGNSAGRDLQEAQEKLQSMNEATTLALRLQTGSRSAADAFNARLVQKTAG